MGNRVHLDTQITVSGRDIENAWAAQAKELPTVSNLLELLRGATAERAAAELNPALDIDVFQWLARGWTTIGAVRNAMRHSLVAPDPPSIMRLDQHTVASGSQLVLNTYAPDIVLPELVLALVLTANVTSATLGIRDGGIELLALGDATLIARLSYGDLILKQHVASVEGAARDPFRHRRVVNSLEAVA